MYELAEQLLAFQERFNSAETSISGSTSYWMIPLKETVDDKRIVDSITELFV